MKNMRQNPDIEHVNTIREGIDRKNGLCPCKVQLTEESKIADLCPCDELFEKSVCHCKLYVPIKGGIEYEAIYL